MAIVLRTLIVSMITIVGDFILKKSADTNHVMLLIGGIVLYVLNAILWFWVYKIGQFSTVGVLYSLFTVFFSVAIGTLYFHESLGAKEVLGIAMGITSLLLLGKFV